MTLLFADDVVLLASVVDDLQHALERFTAESEVAGMLLWGKGSPSISGSCSQVAGRWSRWFVASQVMQMLYWTLQ